MRPFTGAHVTAIMWTLAAVTLVCFFTLLYGEYRARLDWQHTYTPPGVTHPGASWCSRPDGAAWCP